MIVFEKKLQDHINKIGSLTLNGFTFSLVFEYGNEEYLNKFLTLAKNKAYPLVFLVNGSDDYDITRKEVTRSNARIIIAIQRQQVDLLNKTWYATDYAKILNPIAEKLINQLDKSGAARVSNDYSIQKLPNYTQNDSEDNATIDIWNALVLDFDSITFNTNCI